MDRHGNTISSRTNPRSTTGLVTFGNASGHDAAIAHYKIPKNPDALLREAHELRRAAGIADCVPGIHVIEVLDFDLEQNRLFTRFVEGTSSLFNYLWNRSGLLGSGRFHPLPLVEAGDRIGRWLKKYHESAAHDADPAAVLDVTCRSGLGKLRRLREIAPRFLDKATCDALARKFESPAVADLSSYGLTTIHGDFTLANIPYNERGDLFVLDFTDTRVGFPFEDFVRCWHAVWNIATLSAVRNRRLKPLLDAFAAGYELPSEAPRTSLFQLLLIWNALTQILTTFHIGRATGFSSYLISLWLARANRRLIARLLLDPKR
ncbi:MAG: hypothetical protein DCC68_11155 [Planctomycetota bacterium]|nr:MAG: hypothetical protein DCC68_11155 [Planctomycetota bacterium]